MSIFPESVRMHVYRAFALPMGVEQVVPSRLLVFPKGEPPSNDGRLWKFEQADLEAVVAAFGQRTEPLPVMYAHGEDQAKGKKAAGWVDSISLEPDGIWANVRWTDVARDEIRAGEWGFRSPGFDGDTDPDGYIRPRALAEVSLVNDPAIGGMSPVTAAQNGNDEKEATQMAPTETVNAAKSKAAAFDMQGVLDAIRGAFKLPDAVSDEMLNKLVCDALEGGGAPEDMAPEMPAEAEPPIPAPLLPEALAAGCDPKRKAEAAAVVARYVTAGKVTPATAEHAQRMAEADPVAFAAFLDAAPVVAPAAGQLVNASAADRPEKQLSVAEKLTLKYQSAARRPHFTEITERSY